MKTITEIIPISKRHNFRCYFCGEFRSVKYKTEILDEFIPGKITEVNCCNKCILVDSKEKGYYR